MTLKQFLDHLEGEVHNFLFEGDKEPSIFVTVSDVTLRLPCCPEVVDGLTNILKEQIDILEETECN